MKLFNEDMNRLLKGEAVDMPSFNFKTGKREYRGRKLTLGADDILVIEGIHGLNDRLSQLIPPEHKFKSISQRLHSSILTSTILFPPQMKDLYAGLCVMRVHEVQMLWRPSLCGRLSERVKGRISFLSRNRRM